MDLIRTIWTLVVRDALLLASVGKSILDLDNHLSRVIVGWLRRRVDSSTDFRHIIGQVRRFIVKD